MALVEFDEQDPNQEFHIKSPKISLLGSLETPTMIRLLLKSGLVKNEKQALGLLIAIMIAAFCVTGGIWFLRAQASQNNIFTDFKGNKVTTQQYLDNIKRGVYSPNNQNQ